MNKYFFKFLKQPYKGFTLIELIMAMGILTILIALMTGIFGSVVDAGLDSNATSGVDQDGRFIIARMIYDMQRASQIVTPSAPGASTSPTLTITVNSINYTYGLDANSNLQLTTDQPASNLNSNTTKVQSLTFQRIGIGDANDTVQVKFNVVSRIAEKSGIETKSFQTTIGSQ